MSAILEARNITKRFAGVAALDQAGFSIGAGEVAGIIGENGAGKSTLLGILGGAIAPDSGELYIHGKKQQFRSPGDAAAAGIGVVHQHESLILRFSVAENLALAAGLPAFPRKSQMIDHARALAARYGLDPGDPAAPCETLPVGARQRVEILKALARPVEILLLDEPTAALSPPEVRELLQVIQQLRDRGVAVVLVDHKLHEVREVCERIVVLRRGKVVASMNASEHDESALAAAMIGRPVEADARPAAPPKGEILLNIQNLSTPARRRGDVALQNLNIIVTRGEIVGIAGVDGNGQREIVELLAGLRASSSGAWTCAHAACIPPDRHAEGLILTFGVDENLLLDSELLKQAAPRGVLTPEVRRANAGRAISEYQIRTPSFDAPAAALSGGNQQKIAVARALARKPAVLVAANATRGLDVEAARFVKNQILQFAERGGGVLYISADLDEIAAICHFTFVLSRGAAHGPFPIPWSERDFERAGRIMAGGAA